MKTLIQDLRYATRMLLKRPGFTIVALITLALGIGANTAIFSLVNTVLFSPLPVANPKELFSISLSGSDNPLPVFSYPSYIDFRDRNQVLTGIYGTSFTPMNFSRDGNSERVWGYLATGNYFDTLGVKAFLGRTFTQEEDRAKLASPVAVISYSCWQKRFGADQNVVGKDVIINNRTFKVIGVAPKGFYGTEFLYAPELWVPMTMQPWIEPGNDWLDTRDNRNIFITGRLKQGVNKEQAESSLNILAQQLGKEYPDTEEGKSIKLISPGFILPSIRKGMISLASVLMATVMLVLLIACTNLVNLLLSRAAERRKEIAIRLSLGASRFRLVRQLLTESLILSIIGGAIGLMLAVWIIELFLAFKPPTDEALTLVLNLDWTVLAFSIGVSFLTTMLFGLVPALQATKPELVPALKDTASQSGHHRSVLRSSFVVAQIALSLVLLIAAGLVVRTLQQIQIISPGFEVKNGLLLSFDVGLQGYDKTKGEQFQRNVVEKIKVVPGVRSVSLTQVVPLSSYYNSSRVYIEGQTPLRGANLPEVMVSSIGLNYFSAMGTALLAGRDFTEQDTDKATRVIVVNKAFVKKFYPSLNSHADAIGKRIALGSQEGSHWQIAGVAEDGKYWTIAETPQPFVYFPLLQSYSSTVTMIVRTESNPEEMIGTIRNEVQSLDSNLSLYGIKTLEDHMGISLFPARTAATLLGSFGLLALLLAAIGIYGVTAYSVAQRTREMGIRMALGASTADIFRLILKQGLKFALIGLVIGLIAAFALTRLMGSVLYGVSATDPVTFVLVPLALTFVVLLACCIPACRAAKVDPITALRYE